MMKKYFVLSIFLLFGTQLVRSQSFCNDLSITNPYSENGYSIPIKGTIKVLLVFADAVNNCATPPNSSNWPNGAQAPTNADDYFDPYMPMGGPQAYLTKYFYEASHGQYLVLGDYVHIQVPCASFSSNARAAANAEVQNQISAGTIQFAHGSSLSEFDQWTMNVPSNIPGTAKTTNANGKIDIMIVLWRTNPPNTALACCSGDGLGPASPQLPSCDNRAQWGSCGSNILDLRFFISEYFHGMYGSNNWHNGAGLGIHTFPFATNPWGVATQSGGVGMSNVVNAWDRNHLGWTNAPDRTECISARKLINTTGIEINTNFDISSNLGNGIFILRDFSSSGDAIRLKLPHLQDDPSHSMAKNQYLWIENHQLISTFDQDISSTFSCGVQWEKGMYAYLQVGKDSKTNSSSSTLFSNYPNDFASWIFPLTAEGNYDFVYGTPFPFTWEDCIWDNNSVPLDRFNAGTKSNPFTGFSDVYNFYNGNGDGSLIGSEDDCNLDCYSTQWSDVVGSSVVNDSHAGGDSEDGFSFSNNNQVKISIATNPSSTPVYTLASTGQSTQASQAYENRTIWLNGISIEILQEGIFPTHFGPGAIMVKVRYDDYDVERDTRWCGNIVLSQNDFNITNPSLNLINNSTITIDRGQSATQIYSYDIDPNGQYRFTQPTILTCKANSFTKVNPGSKIIVDNGSTLDLLSGSKMVIENGGEIVVKNGSKLLLESGTNLIVNDGGHVTIEDGATVEYYDNANVVLNGSTAIFEIKGLLDIKGNNTVFKFVGGNNGIGYFKFNAPGSPTANIIASGTGSSMIFSSNSNLNKVLEVTQESMLPPANLALFKIQNCRVELGDDSRIAPLGLTTQISLTGSVFSSTATSSQSHRGVLLFGQQNVLVNGCIFENGKYGLYALLTYGGAPLTLSNCTFQNCVTGLFSNDKGIVLNNCVFQNNSDKAWDAMGMTFPCTVNGGLTQLNNSGLNLNASTGGSFLVTGSSLNQNVLFAMQMDGSSTLTVKCSNVKDNLVSGIVFQNNATLNMSATQIPIGGKVIATGNGETMHANCGNNLYMDYGFNYLMPGTPGAIINGTIHNNCGTQIIAYKNKWSSTLAQPSNSAYSIFNCGCLPNKPIHFQDVSPQNPLGCPIVIVIDPNPNAAKSTPLEFYPNAPTINTTTFSNVPLNEAVQLAMDQMKIENPSGNDITSVNMFSQILTSPLNNNQFKTDWLKDLAYSKMKESFGNAFFTGQTTNYSVSNPTVQELLSVQDSIIKYAGLNNNLHSKFYTIVDKAETYKFINDYPKALELLDGITSCMTLDSLEIAFLNNTRKLIFVQQLIASGKAKKEDFEKLITGEYLSYISASGINVLNNPDSLLAQVYFVGDTISFTPSVNSELYSWDFGDCNTSTLQYSKHSYQKVGTYTINLTQTFACTTQVKTFLITIYPKPIVNFTKGTIPNCDLKQTVIFNRNAILGNLSAPTCTSGSYFPLDTSRIRINFDWDFASANVADFTDIFSLNALSNSMDTNVSRHFIKGTESNVSLKATLQVKNVQTNAWENTSYSFTYSDSLIIPKLLSVKINVDPLVCVQDTVHFSTIVTGGLPPYTYDWDFGDGSTSALPNPKHKYTLAQNYLISLTVKDSIGCVADVTFGEESNLEKIPMGGELFVPECPTIKGSAVITSTCSYIPVSNIPIGIIDMNGQAQNIPPAITDANGVFEFSPNQIATLGQSQLYNFYIPQPSKFAIRSRVFNSIENWESLSPFYLEVATAVIDTIIISPTPDSIIANQTVSDSRGNRYAIEVNQNNTGYVTNKYDSTNNLLWTVPYQGWNNGSDTAAAISIDSLGFVYTTGQSWNGSNYDYLTFKYDSIGQIEWIAVYNDSANGNDKASAICSDTDGVVCVTGRSWNGQTYVYTTLEYKQCPGSSNVSLRMAHENNENSSVMLNESFLKIFPNPSNGTMTISYAIATGQSPTQLDILDVTGRVFKSYVLKPENNTMSISDPDLPSGIYLCQIVSDGQILVQEKLIIIN